ncbi:hypothetical protein [Tumebacillus flagellatus]|nr:hypothetical protein [Tumebacillus flagellatus]
MRPFLKRAEVAAVILRNTLRRENAVTASFTDFAAIPAYAQPAVAR